ncbi:PilZ domain-containing protein [Magnetofaba australis]|uniref:Putative hemerythrin n=1 Tax=Magnetofaba australis IT-1 TaxID=1434232 RepID=A0A1Y2K370_9PROT|nr:PilZ domain-containing protein [Magnetofaba australis]OSM02498.1 putative hemerythrin [Magnetofaba australis IT-1]
MNCSNKTGPTVQRSISEQWRSGQDGGLDQRLCVGFPDVDAQHETLLILLTTMRDVLFAEAGIEVVKMTATLLEGALAEHLGYEESVLKACMDADLHQKHCLGHGELRQEFTGALKVILREAEAGRGSGTNATILFDDLKQWFFHHIMQDKRDFPSCLLTKGKANAAPRAVRYPVNLPCELRIKGQEQSVLARTMQISITGALVSAPELMQRLKLDDELMLNWPGSKEEAKTSCAVARLDGDAFGACFGEGKQTLLNQLLELSLYAQEEA